MNRKKIPTLIGVVFLVAGVVAGVLLVQQREIFRLGASGEDSPKDVRVSNITDNAFTISWTTGRKAVGYVEWGETQSLGQLARQEDSSLKYIHSVTFRQLTPSTNYFFVVNSGGKVFNNGGVPWSVQTGPTLPVPQESLLISGTILTNTGSPAANILVYVTTGGTSQLSTTTSSNGSWIIPISSARTNTLSSYANIDPDATILDIFAQGGADGVATAKTYVKNANPAADITLGQSYDFRDQTLNTGSTVSQASVDLPEIPSTTPSSGAFEIQEGESSQTSGLAVSLESIQDDGEIIFTDSPEFSGSGPANQEITITVESEA